MGSAMRALRTTSGLRTRFRLRRWPRTPLPRTRARRVSERRARRAGARGSMQSLQLPAPRRGAVRARPRQASSGTHEAVPQVAGLHRLDPENDLGSCPCPNCRVPGIVGSRCDRPGLLRVSRMLRPSWTGGYLGGIPVARWIAMNPTHPRHTTSDQPRRLGRGSPRR